MPLFTVQSTKPAPTANSGRKENIMNSELIATKGEGMTSYSFKNDRLNAISADISEVIRNGKADIERYNKQLCELFGEVKTSKCYEDDGFKSVADYANAVFGVKRSAAYQFAAVGERFYNAEELPEEVGALVQSTTPSKLAELVNMSNEDITAHVNDGTLTADTTQADMRELAKAAKADDKPSVVPAFNYYSNLTAAPVFTGIHDDFCAQWIEPVNIVKAGAARRASDGKEYTFTRWIVESTDADGNTIDAKVYYAARVEKPKTGKKAKREPFDLKSYLESLSPEERKEALNLLK